ncbi:MAG: 3-phosphoglycerate dehydrogenase [Saprospirales bacterium]|nr:MAG: 3-phosphoglycerate dehydrogenase [Saprospirales bacterium]
MKILANDGIHPRGKDQLEKAGFIVDTQKIEQGDLKEGLRDYHVILVRSATKVTADIIVANPQLKIIGRAGVGLDNIDLKAAENAGVKVINTPAASSRSVAELAFSHMLNLARFGHLSNREMPKSGTTEFKKLKKNYSAGIELYGKNLGIIGLGRIGREVARIGLGLGMTILPVDPFVNKSEIEVDIYSGNLQKIKVSIDTVESDDMLAEADFVSIHVPSTKEPIIGAAQFKKLKKGVILINSSRGGAINEDLLLAALEDNSVAGAGLDVFVGEPNPRAELVNHPRISVSPHIGASTSEAQSRIGEELADQIIEFFEN